MAFSWNLDLFTLGFVLSSLSLVLALFLLVLQTAVPRYPGIFRWSLGTALIGLAFMLTIVCTEKSFTLGLIITNTALAGGLAMIGRGSWAFLKRSIPIGRLAYLAPGLVFISGLIMFRQLPDVAAWYFALTLLVLAGQSAIMAIALLFRFPFKQRGAPRYTAAIYILASLYFLAESLTSFLSHRTAISDFTIPSRSVLALMISLVAWTIGLILMTTSRLAEELAAHEQAAARQERYDFIQTIIDYLPQYIVLKDKNLRYLACNAAFGRLVGKDTEAIIGNDDRNHFPKPIAERFLTADREVMANGSVREYCEQICLQDHDSWVETTRIPVFNQHGVVEGILTVFHDITERFKADRALQASERRYRELSSELERRVEQRSRQLSEAQREIDIYFEVTPNFFCLMEMSGQLKKLSPSWAKLFNQAEQTIIGRNLSDFLHPDDQASFQAQLPELQAGNKCQDLRLRVSLDRTEWHWWSWTCIGLPERGFLIGVAHDISAQVEAVERIDQARLAAERASKAKSVFISTMSHELRTPLNAVLGYSVLLENMVTDDKAKRHLRSINSAGRSLLAIINDLLDLSKAESGRIELQPSPSDPRQLLEELVELFRFAAEGKPLIIVLEASQRLPATMLIDANRVRQVMINLVGNAVKFTERGNICVSLDATSEPNSLAEVSGGQSWQTSLVIEISDTGIGMSADYVKDLFEAFSQENTSIARRYGGTGLGLAIAKRLLNLMDAAINCESQIGQGTKFRIVIPGIISSGAGLATRIVIGEADGSAPKI